MRDLVISDPHLGLKRIGGTTQQSRIDLEEWQFAMLEETLKIPHDRLIINGDLFDKKSVSEQVLLRTYEILKDENVILLRGNHDEGSMQVNNICSLQLLAAILPNCKLIFDRPETIGDYHFIPHCFDQDEFDRYVEETPVGKTVFIHANFDNFFATQADHSLNFSGTQRNVLIKKNCHVLLGHEHGAYRDVVGITFLGCHAPTSIADCLSGAKLAWLITDGEITPVTVWNQSDYIELEHTDIKLTDHKFVRINGECTIAEYPGIVRQIADLRKKSNAFIIANNVKVAVSEREKVDADEVTAFNILELLLENIDEEFKEEVKSCI